MASVLLVYPYFRPFLDLTIFRQPPLGVSYVAASLRKAGHEVQLLDCTFLKRDEAWRAALAAEAEVVGVYCMASMVRECLWFARGLRGRCGLLVAGGPLPTCEPSFFLRHFDLVVLGEGEQTMVDILRAWKGGAGLGSVSGVAFRGEGGTVRTSPRPLTGDLDSIPFPARDLLPNRSYIRSGKARFGYSLTTVMSSRGCPYACEFCSNVIFGGSYRERSPANLVDEIEEALGLGYDRIAFADDVFTMNPSRVLKICAEIRRRGLQFKWECLGRVDALDFPTAREMKKAGCTRIFFGLESGSNEILKLMNKKTTRGQAGEAVQAAHRAGLRVGAFFILFYPGETDDTVLETLRFAASLPLEYLGLSMPYPLPGTALFERVKDRINRDWRPSESLLRSHVLIFRADFSEAKMRFGILKGRAQFEIRSRLGRLAPPVLKLFEKPTDALLRLLK
jgi:anaerobic magnesium-protoporphyrin IX monomethyl ester cyclase